jgi:glycerol-3-phosphate acyltransferase PlsY
VADIPYQSLVISSENKIIASGWHRMQLASWISNFSGLRVGDGLQASAGWIAVFTLVGYLLGSIPFSVWLGRISTGKDIRNSHPDGNPGAANAWRAGGWKLGAAVLVLDFLKGALPVALCHYQLGFSGWQLLPIALAPIAGHAFSLFLGGRGGKALAVTFGVWTGLTAFAGPLVLGFLFTVLINFLEPAWAVMTGMAGLLLYLLVQPEPAALVLTWVGNFAILAWKHRAELRAPIRKSQS